MNRREHLQWAKDRAIEYVKAGDLAQAFASFTSDLRKHDELRPALELQMSLGCQLLTAGHLDRSREMAQWIEGFN